MASMAYAATFGTNRDASSSSSPWKTATQDEDHQLKQSPSRSSRHGNDDDEDCKDDFCEHAIVRVNSQDSHDDLVLANAMKTSISFLATFGIDSSITPKHSTFLPSKDSPTGSPLPPISSSATVISISTATSTNTVTSAAIPAMFVPTQPFQYLDIAYPATDQILLLVEPDFTEKATYTGPPTTAAGGTAATVGSPEIARTALASKTTPTTTTTSSETSPKKRNKHPLTNLVPKIRHKGTDSVLLLSSKVLASIPHCLLPSPQQAVELARMHCTGKYWNLMFHQWNERDMEEYFVKYDICRLIQPSNNNNDEDPAANSNGSQRMQATATEIGIKRCRVIMNTMRREWKESFGNQPRHGQRDGIGASDSNNIDRSCRGIRISSSSNEGTANNGANHSDSAEETVPIGAIGRDIGVALTYPLAYNMVRNIHASNASSCHSTANTATANTATNDADRSIITAASMFWDAYAVELYRMGKQDDCVESAHASGTGWAGWFLYLCYCRLQAYRNVLPQPEIFYIPRTSSPSTTSTNNAAPLLKYKDYPMDFVEEAIGTVGLKMMRWGFGKLNNKSSKVRTKKAVAKNGNVQVK